ncbi:hypothetical protein P691DRAFT_768043, partial [Macrolepiota fuliginosa MF-IS2]
MPQPTPTNEASTQEYTCSLCKSPCTSRAKRDSHMKYSCTKKQYTAVFNGVEVQLPYENGMYICHCSYKLCNRKYATCESIKRHAGQGYSWVNPAEVVSVQGTQGPQAEINLERPHPAITRPPKVVHEKEYAIKSPVETAAEKEETERLPSVVIDFTAISSKRKKSKATAVSSVAHPQTKTKANTKGEIAQTHPHAKASSHPIAFDTETSTRATIPPLPQAEVDATLTTGTQASAPDNDSGEEGSFVLTGDNLKTLDEIRHFGVWYQSRVNSILCFHCPCLLLPTNAIRHMNDIHGAQLRDSQKFVILCDELGLAQKYPTTELLDGTPALHGLRVYPNALRCGFVDCGSIFTKESSLKHHHHTCHPKGSRPPSTTVHAQRITKKHPFFSVQLPSTVLKLEKSTKSQREWVNRIYDAIQEASKPAVLTSSDPRNINGWLRLTRYPSHVGDHQPEFLRSLVATPKDVQFSYIVAAVEFLLREAADQASRLPDHISQLINTKDPRQGINRTPFSGHQNDSTFRQYAADVARLVGFLLREKEPYELLLPDGVLALINEVRTSLLDKNTLANKICNLLEAIWTRTWDKSQGNTIGDPTMCFVALSSIREHHGWASPSYVTPILARLIFGIRCVFIRQMFRSGDLHEHFKVLQNWMCEGFESTFNSLVNLQALATSFVYNTPTLPDSFWADNDFTTLIYLGDEITLQGFRDFASEIHQRLYNEWTKVLMGLELRNEWGNTDSSRPAGQKRSRLRDNFSDTTPGYSFFSDPNNLSIQTPLKLVDAILDNPDLHDKFVCGYLPGTGEPIWNLLEMRRWVLGYAEFLKLLMACVEALAGSPSRGTELTCIQYANTALRSRGLYAFGSHITVLCQYSKTTSMTGRDKILPHACDSFCGDFIVQAVSIGHPFARWCLAILYPCNPEYYQLYNTYLFVNMKKLFTTDDLTDTLKGLTRPTMNVGLGVRSYRHVSIAFRRVHCSEFEKAIGLDDEDSAGALQAGHSRSTENRIYGITTSVLSGNTEETIRAFLRCSEQWQRLLRVPTAETPLPWTLLKRRELWE